MPTQAQIDKYLKELRERPPVTEQEIQDLLAKIRTEDPQFAEQAELVIAMLQSAITDRRQ